MYSLVEEVPRGRRRPKNGSPIVHLATNVLGSADDGGHDLLRWLAQA
jgi:hypothetical protein